MNWTIAASVATVALSLPLVTGCASETRPACQPVRGQVTQGGRPVAEAVVVFHPQSATAESAPRPLATTDAEGRFVLTTFAHADGAPEGEYAITIELRAPRQVGEEIVRDGPNQLPAKYARPETTDQRYTVVAGENTVPTIALPAR